MSDSPSSTSSAGSGKTDKSSGDDRIVIKKYANRRLYNTASSSYVTLEHLREMTKEGTNFVVYDAKTGEDITRSVLAQIIFDEEGRGGQTLLPIPFLRQLICFYGDQMQSFVPGYLEASLDAFTRQQERMREQLTEAFGKGPNYGLFDDQVRQNLALFDRAMKMFTPFAFTARADEPAAAPPPPPPEPAKAAASDTALDDLKRRIEEMQTQIAKLASKDKE